MRVICQICHRPVERLESSQDRDTMDFVITAFCHGQTDKMTVAYSQIAQDPSLVTAINNAREGVAFAGKHLPDVRTCD